MLLSFVHFQRQCVSVKVGMLVKCFGDYLLRNTSALWAAES